jgi:hypothetical protein
MHHPDALPAEKLQHEGAESIGQFLTNSIEIHNA